MIEELDIESGEREIAAEPAVDARPEAEVLKQLACLEVRAEEPLFRVDRDATLEADSLRLGAAVYQKKDSGTGNRHKKASVKGDKCPHYRQGRATLLPEGSRSRFRFHSNRNQKLEREPERGTYCVRSCRCFSISPRR